MASSTAGVAEDVASDKQEVIRGEESSSLGALIPS